MDLIRLQSQVCQNLIRGCTSLSLVEDVPAGCALSSSIQETNVYLLVRGQVDIYVEIEKFKAKVEKINNLSNALDAKMKVHGYKQVKQEVVDIDTEKLNGYAAEITALKSSITQFELFL